MSCNTNASRSAGASTSSTPSSASPTESASTAQRPDHAVIPRPQVVGKTVEMAGVPPVTLELVHLRVSQINRPALHRSTPRADRTRSTRGRRRLRVSAVTLRYSAKSAAVIPLA